VLCVFQEALLRRLQVATQLVFSHQLAIERITEPIDILYQVKTGSDSFHVHHGIPKFRRLPSLRYAGHPRWPGARAVEIVGSRPAYLSLHHLQATHPWATGKLNVLIKWDDEGVTLNIVQDDYCLCDGKMFTILNSRTTHYTGRYNTSMPDLAIPPAKCLKSVLLHWKEESMVRQISLSLSFSLSHTHTHTHITPCTHVLEGLYLA
jgi:hypothetical protein